MSLIYPGAGTAVQTCFVVPDLDEAMARWQRVGGAGPFFMARRLELLVTYRGCEASMTTSLALAQVGSFHVELIQQHSSGPSVYREGLGVHHIGIPVPDVAAAVAYYTALGFETAMTLTFGDTPVAYIDTRAAIGCMTEVLRNDPPILQLYDDVARAARDWDGSEPIRPLSLPTGEIQ